MPRRLRCAQSRAEGRILREGSTEEGPRSAIDHEGGGEVTRAIASHKKTPLDLIDKASPIYKHAAWFLQSLRSSARAPGTIAVYIGAVHEYDKFAEDNDLPRSLADIESQHLELFMLDQLSRLRPASAAARHAGLRAQFAWAMEQGQIDTNPMAKLRPPTTPETPVPVLTDTQVRAIVKACEGKGFKQRRDMALIRLMLNTGLRRSEAAGIRNQDLDLMGGTVLVIKGKGSRSREVSFDSKTSSAIYAYQIERDQQPHAASPFLFIGQQGGLSGDAVGAIVARRARMAGVLNLDQEGKERPIHAHQTGHTLPTSSSSPGDRKATYSRWADGGRWRFSAATASRGRPCGRSRRPSDSPSVTPIDTSSIRRLRRSL